MVKAWIIFCFISFFNFQFRILNKIYTVAEFNDTFQRVNPWTADV